MIKIIYSIFVIVVVVILYIITGINPSNDGRRSHSSTICNPTRTDSLYQTKFPTGSPVNPVWRVTQKQHLMQFPIPNECHRNRITDFHFRGSCCVAIIVVYRNVRFVGARADISTAIAIDISITNAVTTTITFILPYPFKCRFRWFCQ